MKSHILTGVVLSVASFATSQGKVVIKSGAHWVQGGATRVVLNDVSFENSGNLDMDLGYLTFRGTAATASTTISSSSNIYQLEVDKSANGILANGDLTLTNQLILTSGYLDLGTQKLTLSGASIIGESASNYVTGGTGELEMNMSVDNPSQLDPGNIGIQLTSSQNLGTTTFIRGHEPFSTGDHTGIDRFITITPANNTGLNATFRMYYADSELNGMDENELVFYRFDGASWSNEGSTTRNTTENWVELTGINAFSTWTLSSPSSNPLPVELEKFHAFQEKETILVKWETSEEINNDYFLLEKSIDAVHFKVLKKVDGSGNSEETKKYEYLDHSPNFGSNYYRLTQVDFDGTRKVYPTIALQFEGLIQSGIQAYPNPAKASLNITVSDSKYSELNLSIVSMQGQVVYKKRLNLNGGKLKLPSVAAGNYLLTVSNFSGTIIHQQKIRISQ